MQLGLALYAEGPSDNRFLPLIIQRTAQNIMDQQWPIDQREDIELLDVKIIPKQREDNRADCILSAAKEASKYQALVVHSDADDKTSEQAHKERIQPGFDLVFELKSTETVCEYLIPLIPVQTIEAWMLADSGALLGSIRVRKRPQNLKLPKVSEVERDANPKATLNEIIRNANSNRSSSKRTAGRLEISINECYERLANSIDLNILSLVPSYQAFRNDLAQALTTILGHPNT